VRDSPALDIVKRLAEEGASIIAYDPAAMERAAAQFMKHAKDQTRLVTTHGMAAITGSTADTEVSPLAHCHQWTKFPDCRRGRGRRICLLQYGTTSI
jgi:UDP-glucose 6-dehydrogenase